MNFRKATKDDFHQVMRLINMGKEYFRLKNSSQWQNGYPDEKCILKDIDNQWSYLLEIQGKAVATLALVEGDEYSIFKHVDWILPGQKYLTIHRVSVDYTQQRRGYGTLIMKEVENMCKQKQIKSLRTDTRIENIEMIQLAKKCGYKNCGIIFLQDEKKFQVFEKSILSNKLVEK